jgi:Family of unknown function (DUF5856)
MDEIAITFLYIKDQLQIYHWSTSSFSRHKGSDQLIDSMTLLIDKFMETMIGIEGKRFSLKKKSKIILNNETDSSIIKVLKSFRSWLSDDLPKYIKNDTDLINIRDEMLAEINKTLYLFTLE